MITTNYRLYNLTTGIMHTNLEDVYKFIETFTGARPQAQWQLPIIIPVINQFLRKRLPANYFIKQYRGEREKEKSYTLKDLSEEERLQFWERYNQNLATNFKRLQFKKESRLFSIWYKIKLAIKKIFKKKR